MNKLIRLFIKAFRSKSFSALAVMLLIYITLAMTLANSWHLALVIILGPCIVMACIIEFYLRQKKLNQETIRLISNNSQMLLQKNNELAMNTHSAILMSHRFFAEQLQVTEYSMCATNLGVIMDILKTRNPKKVVELGCGLSTILVASWLKEKGDGKIVSFENADFWAEKCSSDLRYNGLTDFGEVRTVSLGSCPGFGEQFLWYKLDGKIQDIRNIDLLIVDGPQAIEEPLSRLPALKVFYDLLSIDATVFLDDGDRIGERKTVERWCAEYPDFEAKFISSLTGAWVLVRKRQ
jgi:hypothetical protein